MLARLPSALPSAVSLTKGSSLLLKVSAPVRCNSSEAAVPQAPSDGQASRPKRRAIPIADSLGGIDIANEPRRGGQRGNDNWRQNGAGQGGANFRQQRPQQDYSQAGGQRTGDRVNAGQRWGSSGQRNGQQNDQWNGQRNGQQNGHGNGQRNGRWNGQRNDQWNGNRVAQHTRREETVSTRIQGSAPVQAQADRRRSAPSRQESEEDEDEDGPVAMPTVQKIELGNLEDIFGPPVVHDRTRSRTPASATESPAQDRIQSLLERTAGDYSRYVPKLLPSTDVRELSPLELGGFVLSKRRDVGLNSRQHALEVIQKFPGTGSTSKGVQAQSPSL
ncbi:hypothetical protein BV20DRAFT_968612 [Pilatotrama ljubarskyi]|nr:hypothetical protein BV20DRAFT_968612 [Pilatotrama ljubarskyi]